MNSYLLILNLLSAQQVEDVSNYYQDAFPTWTGRACVQYVCEDLGAANPFAPADIQNIFESEPALKDPRETSVIARIMAGIHKISGYGYLANMEFSERRDARDPGRIRNEFQVTVTEARD